MNHRPIAADQHHLDVTASPAFLGLYTQLCLVYAVPDPSRHSDIIQRLENGLERLSASFPWIAGQVFKEGRTLMMKPLGRTPRLVVKDYTNDPSFPTLKDYRAANYPFSMLDESVICPVNTLPGDFALKSTPILLVQVNFIVGGMLLTFNAEHCTMDMPGQAQVISLLSKACKGEAFTKSELLDGNVDRRNMFKLLENYELGPELRHQIKKPNKQHNRQELEQEKSGETKESWQASQPAECVWSYFTFSNESLIQLKALASESLTSGYVSTDDTLTAFLWKLVSRARLQRYASNTESTFARAVDARRFLGVSKTYQGLLTNMTYHTFSLEHLANAPLGSIAADFRQAVDPKTTKLEYNTRALATAFVQAEDKSMFSVTATLQLDKDIALSSWANINTYDLDFGLGIGKPESVRRPRLGPVESLVYLMPRDPQGNTAAAICLRVEDMDAVRADPEFAKFAVYVG